jgi:hypothetical protein
MPKRRLRSGMIIPVSRPSTVIVLDYSFAAALGLPRISGEVRSVADLNAYLKNQLAAIDEPPAWVRSFRAWVLLRQPTLISLHPDTALDSILFPDFIAPQSYGFGIPAHVPALFKPNGSLNWFYFTDGGLPRSVRGFLPLQWNGLACHPGSASSILPRLPGTRPAIDLEPLSAELFLDIRSTARQRLEAAREILILSLEPTQLSTSDMELLRNLTPTKRLTLVSRTPAVGRTLRDLCGFGAHCDLEMGDIDSWITQRLNQWDSVQVCN